MAILGLGLCGGTASAQVPAIPGAGVAAAPAGLAAPGPRVGFFQRICNGVDGCIQKILPSPFGQFLNNMTKPLSALTGGIIPTLDSKKPSEEALKKPGVAGAAAAGKKDALEAAERRANVKFLGTLDCRYYPDAAKALADALRTDPSECVRYEAALGLSRGCCCNSVTVAALSASVSGYDLDGNPAERSSRVRCTAAIGLERCLACWTPPAPEPTPEVKPVDPILKGEGEGKTEGEKEKEKEKEKPKDGGTGAKSIPASKQSIEKAREILSAFKGVVALTEMQFGNQAASPVAPSKSVLGLIQASANEPRTAIAPAMPERRIETPALVARAPKVVEETPMPVAKTFPVPSEAIQPVLSETFPVAAPSVPGPIPTFAAPKPIPAPAEVDPETKVIEALAHKILLGEKAAEQHAAIRDLVKYDWVKYPIVASCLVAGAKSESSGAVRVDCLRHLAHNKMAHKDVIAALDELKKVEDTWIADEAAKAHETLKAIR